MNQNSYKTIIPKTKAFWDSYDYRHCPRCNAPLVPALSIANTPSTDWLTCSQTTCNTYVDTYTPLPHQVSVHTDTHRIIGNFGSFGTGKTKTSEKEIEKHIFITPGANILLGAAITSQYEQTLQRDFEMSFPQAFLDSKNQQKAYMDFINGARLMMRPFYDPNNLRSNNYSMAVSLEASESPAESFHTVKNRLRNMKAAVPLYDPNTKAQALSDEGDPLWEADWRKFIVESNPDSGYIRTDVLLVADEIKQFGRFCNEHYDRVPETIDRFTSAHVASTDVNPYLPGDYIQVNSANKPEWWIRRFLHGSFLFAEGLVYPGFMKCVVPTPTDRRPNPKWKIVIAHDYGLMDKATFLFGGIDEERGKLIIYKNVETNEQSVKNLADLFKKNVEDINFGQMYTTPIIDPKNNKRDYDKKDLITHYSEYGITFQPGYINLDARIYRLNDYIEQGRLEVWDCCLPLINEMKEYKFKPKTLNDTSSDNKPQDKNNHSINPVEWITMVLPANPKHLTLGMLDQFGRDIQKETKKIDQGGWQLGDYNSLQNDDAYDTSSAFGIEGGF